MRSLSLSALTSIHAQETGEVWLPIIEINADGWPEPERFVANTWAAITSGGLTYDPLPFVIGLPDDGGEDTPSEITLSIDNVSREIGRALRLVDGAATVTLRYVLSSSPDVVEIGPIEFAVLSYSIDANQVTAALSVEPLLDQQFGRHVLNPVNAPGLF